MVRVFLVDGSPAFAAAALRFLEGVSGLTVVGQAVSGQEAVDRMHRFLPDVMLVGEVLADMSGVEATRRIKQAANPPKVVLVTPHESAPYRQAAEAAGADGTVGKWEFSDSVVPAITGAVPPTSGVPRDLRAARLRTLAHVNHLVSAALDRDDVHPAITRGAAELMGAPHVSCWIADEDARAVTLACRTDAEAPGDVSRPQVSYGEGGVGWVAAHRQPLHVPDIAGRSSFLAVPILAGDALLAVLAMGGRGTFRLGAEEQDVLDAFLAHAALTIRHARREHDMRRRHDDLRAMVDQSAQVLQAEKLACMNLLLETMAHELGNPLVVVLGQAELLQLAAGHADQSLARRADRIRAAAIRCSRIVKAFVAMGRRRPPERQQTSLDRVVAEALDLMEYTLQANRVDLALDLASDLPDISGDPDQLHQVVVNLVSNACHAMHGTPRPHRVRLTSRWDPGAAQVTLEVADSGPGVPTDIRQRIFEPCFTTKPRGQGTGLGLSLCRDIVAAHGGTIQVADAPGGGASFTIALPLGEIGGGIAPEPEPPEAAPLADPLSILVVEDDPALADLVQEMLEEDGHRVETAANGGVALRRLEEAAFDVIVSDIRMPGLDGRALHRTLESRSPALARRIVFMTGDALDPDTADFLERAGVPSLAKPFSAGDLLLAVRVAAAG